MFTKLFLSMVGLLGLFIIYTSTVYMATLGWTGLFITIAAIITTGFIWEQIYECH